MLSQHLDPRYAMRLIEQAPSRAGYLLEERVGRVQELTDAVHRIEAGECVTDRVVAQQLVERARRTEPLAELSERAREIPELMAEGGSNRGFCETLWLSPKTVDPHIRSLFLKLDLGNVPQDDRRVLAVLTYLRTGGPDT